MPRLLEASLQSPISAIHVHRAASVSHRGSRVNESSAPCLLSGVSDTQVAARGECLEKAQAWSHPIGHSVRVLCVPVVRMQHWRDNFTWRCRRPNRDAHPLRNRGDRERAGLGPGETDCWAHSR